MVQAPSSVAFRSAAGFGLVLPVKNTFIELGPSDETSRTPCRKRCTTCPPSFRPGDEDDWEAHVLRELCHSFAPSIRPVARATGDRVPATRPPAQAPVPALSQAAKVPAATATPKHSAPKHPAPTHAAPAHAKQTPASKALPSQALPAAPKVAPAAPQAVDFATASATTARATETGATSSSAAAVVTPSAGTTAKAAPPTPTASATTTAETAAPAEADATSEGSTTASERLMDAMAQDSAGSGWCNVPAKNKAKARVTNAPMPRAPTGAAPRVANSTSAPRVASALPAAPVAPRTRSSNPAVSAASGVSTGKGSGKGKGKGKGLSHFVRIPVGIEDDHEFRVVQKLIGPRGKFMQDISAASGDAKIWIIGRGSRSWEDDVGPLTICVGAASATIFDSAVGLVTELLERVRREHEKLQH